MCVWDQSVTVEQNQLSMVSDAGYVHNACGDSIEGMQSEWVSLGSKTVLSAGSVHNDYDTDVEVPDYLIATEQGWSCPTKFYKPVNGSVQCNQVSNAYSISADLFVNDTGTVTPLEPRFIHSRELVDHIDTYFDGAHGTQGVEGLGSHCVVLASSDLSAHPSRPWNYDEFGCVCLHLITPDPPSSRLCSNQYTHAENLVKGDPTE